MDVRSRVPKSAPTRSVQRPRGFRRSTDCWSIGERIGKGTIAVYHRGERHVAVRVDTGTAKELSELSIAGSTVWPMLATTARAPVAEIDSVAGPPITRARKAIQPFPAADRWRKLGPGPITGCGVRITRAATAQL